MSDGSFFHVNRSTVKRSEGRSAVATAAYCTGTSIYDATERTTQDYSKKPGVVEAFVTTPEDKPGLEWAHDIAALSNAMEAHEKRKDAQVGHQWRIALPSELDTEQRSELTHDIAQVLSDMYGVGVIAGIHAPDAEGDQRNHHAHLLFTSRVVEEDGLGAKVTSITGPKTSAAEVTRFRKVVADLTNEALEQAESETRVSHLSYAERGIEKTPTIHLGAAATGQERDGLETERGDINAAIIAERIAEQERLSAAIARQFEEEPQRISLETERELARRFGDEWQEAKPSDCTALPQEAGGEWQHEAPALDARDAMQGEVDRVAGTGTTHGSGAVHRWMEAQGRRFFEFIRNESGAPDLLSDEVPEELAATAGNSPPEPDEGRSWISRVWEAGRNALHAFGHPDDTDAPKPASFTERLPQGPPEEHSGDDARPGGHVEPPAPDDRPQEEAGRTMSAFDTLAASIDASAPELGSERPSAFHELTAEQTGPSPVPPPMPAPEPSMHTPEP